MNKLLIPNTCQVPNVLLDKVMPRLGNASLRVLLAITRLTYGFGDPGPRKISYTRLQKATGLSRQGVANGINGLGNIVTINPGPKNERVENEYSLNLDVATGELVNKLDQSTILTSQRRVKRLVNEVDSLKPNAFKPNKAREPEDASTPANLTPVLEKKNRRAASAVPADLQPIIYRAIARMNELAGTAYEPDSKIVINGLFPRLTAGASEADCIAVIEDRWQRWRADHRMRQHFNPDTLFREDNFEKYKNAVRMGGNVATDRLYGSGGFVG